MVDIKQLRTMETKDLAKVAVESARSLFRLRLQATMGKLKNFNLIKNKRKEIARMKTVLTEKEVLDSVGRRERS